MSKFADWFRGQHGLRQSGIFKHVSDGLLRDAIQRGREAEAELKRREAWDGRRESALYAWTAREDAMRGEG